MANQLNAAEHRIVEKYSKLHLDRESKASFNSDELFLISCALHTAVSEGGICRELMSALTKIDNALDNLLLTEE